MGKLYCKVEHKWCKYLKRGVCTYCNTELCSVCRCPRLAEIETIRFADIIRQTNFNDVWSVLVKHYPDQCNGKAAYERVYNSLLLMTPRKHNLTDMFIRIARQPADKYCDHDWYDVHGIQLDKPIHYGIEFLPWINWVSMFITNDTLEILHPAEITAHCLWEMTFCGFTEDIVDNHLKEIEKSIEECINKK